MREKKHEPECPAARTAAKIQDEIYRHMFRVDAGVPDAGLDLVMTLVRAWLAVEREPEDSDLRTWLRVISPLCMEMIDATRHCQHAAQNWVN